LEQEMELAKVPPIPRESTTPFALVEKQAVFKVRIDAAEKDALMAERRSAPEIEPVHCGHDAALEEPFVAVQPTELREPIAVRRGQIDVPGDPSPI
jgi:hypothetical protein